jgi:hypothetical protein
VGVWKEPRESRKALGIAHRARTRRRTSPCSNASRSRASIPPTVPRQAHPNPLSAAQLDPDGLRSGGICATLFETLHVQTVSQRRQGDGERTATQAADATLSERHFLSRSRRHRRRVMIDDLPPAVLYEREAIPCRQCLRFSVLHIRERVIAGVNSSVAINTDQLFTETDLVTARPCASAL